MSRNSQDVETPGGRLSDVFADALPGAHRMGLRERKKVAAMRRIQETAVNLFERDGFDRVTVEQVAEQASVSPSSVYRYFGTKEGLILRDEYDDTVLAAADVLFADHDPWTAFARAMEIMAPTHFVHDDLALRRTRIWYETPSIRAAGFVLLDETAKALAEVMHANDRYGRSLGEYQTLSSTIMAAFYTCLEQWYRAGGRRNIAADVADVLELIRPAWAVASPDPRR